MSTSQTTPPPVNPPPTTETPSREILPSQEGERPPTGQEAPPSELELTIEGLNQLGDEATTEQMAATFASLLLAHNRQPGNEHLVADIASISDEKIRGQMETLRTELTELYDTEGKSLWLSGFETAPKGAEAQILAGVSSLILKGQMNAKLLTALVSGGIEFAQTNQYKRRHESIDEIAHFFPPGGDHAGSRIVFYQTAFGDNMDPARVLYHELGHALLLQNGLIYELDDFRSPSQTGPTPTSPEMNSVENPAPRLDQSEWTMFSTAFNQPARQRPWETPYIAQLLDELAKPGAADAKLHKHILEEMLAERVRLYLESDGSLGDFVKKRLINSTAIQNKTNVTPEQAAVAAPMKSIALSLDAMLGELTGASSTSPSYLEMLHQFVDQAAADGTLPDNLQLPLKGFLTESYQLHRRFSRLMGAEGHTALLRVMESRPAIPSEYPLGGDWETGEPVFLGQRPAGAPRINKDKTLWKWVMEAFSDLASAFRG